MFSSKWLEVLSTNTCRDHALRSIIVFSVLMASAVAVSLLAVNFLSSGFDPNDVLFNISSRGECDRRLHPDDLKAIEFKTELPTYVIIHEYPSDENKNITWVRDLRNTLLRREDCIVITVDYLKLSDPQQPAKAQAVPVFVGGVVAALLKRLQKEKGLDINTMEIIGFSVGAHTAGVVGKNLQGIGKITALDPAGPMFEEKSSEVEQRCLHKSDAKRVVTHCTNAGGRSGHVHTLGDVNVLYNGGRTQPGCNNSLCDQKRAVEYYNVTICEPDMLLYPSQAIANTYACDKGSYFSRVSEQLKGNFHVNTDGEYPYFRIRPPFSSVGCKIVQIRPPFSSVGCQNGQIWPPFSSVGCKIGQIPKNSRPKPTCLPIDSVCISSETK